MKAIKFDLKIWKVILKKIKLGGKFSMVKYRNDWLKPSIRFDNQVLVKNHFGGICGSDLHQLDVEVSYVTTILANSENPFPIGHEAVGSIDEIGSKVSSFKIGDRVVYNPVATCESYGFELCSSCKEGNYSSCLCLTGTGDGSKLEMEYGGRKQFGGYGGGGFSEYLIAFEKQLFKIPDSLSDDIAILTEPYSVAIHAVARNKPQDKDTVLIIGAGIIGLLVIAAIRSFGIKSKIIVLVRYEHQAKLAKKFGANIILMEQDRKKLYHKIAELTDAKLFKPQLSKEIVYGNSGPDIIFDCVANEKTLDDSLHLIKSNGKIVVVGLGFAVTRKIDWAIVPYKEITVVGTMMSGLEEFNGKKLDAFEIALQFLSIEPQKYSELITHKFKIEDYKTAYKTTMNKGKQQVIKAIFDFNK
ncbi:MAG: zinc-binding dehydrogenase [Asgard group archaeon]|nr:zinc-binding dehydrogenase [Asgard group archaeon]